MGDRQRFFLSRKLKPWGGRETGGWRGEAVENLALMRRIDEQLLQAPSYGVRQMTWRLRASGETVNPKRIRRLMRLMRLMPIYQRPNTRIPAVGPKI